MRTFIHCNLCLKGLECVEKVPLLAGIFLNNHEVALRMADVGPGADDKVEVNAVLFITSTLVLMELY